MTREESLLLQLHNVTYMLGNAVQKLHAFDGALNSACDCVAGVRAESRHRWCPRNLDKFGERDCDNCHAIPRVEDRMVKRAECWREYFIIENSMDT